MFPSKITATDVSRALHGRLGLLKAFKRSWPSQGLERPFR